jgi:hypothetical protein
VTAAAVVDAVCTFFGGPYVAALHTYRTPTVAGVGVVRRAWAGREDFAEYTQGMPAGTATGCVIVVQNPDGVDGPRAALPAVQGRRKVSYDLELHCFFWSEALYVEDCQDAVYALRDAIVAKIRTDPTLGTGGIETGNFQVGEGDGRITWHIEQGGQVDGTTKAYMVISFEAHAYEVG